MKQELNSDQLLDMAEAILEGNHALQIRTQGFSMFPFLRPGDRCVVEKCPPNTLKQGDIVVVKKNNQWIAHRLVRIDNRHSQELFICKGDQNQREDQPATANEIVGKVVSFQRGNQHIFLHSTARKLTTFLTLHASSWMQKHHKVSLQFHQFTSSLSKHAISLKHNCSFVAEGAPKMIWLNACLSVLQGILPFGIILSMKWIVDLLTSQQHLPVNANLLYFYMALTALFFLTYMLLGEIKTYTTEKMTQQVTRHMYAKLHAKHSSLTLSHYETPGVLDKMHRAVQEATFRPVKLLNELFAGLRSLVAALVLTVIFFTIQWYLLLILMVAVFPGVIVRLQLAMRLHQLKVSQSTDERKMHYVHRILTGFPFAKELRLMGYASWFRNKFVHLQQLLFSQRLQLRQSELKQNTFVQLFSVLLVFLALFVVAQLMLQGAITVGTVVLFFLAFQRGYTTLNELFRSLSRIVEDHIFMNDVVQFMEDEKTQPALSEKLKGTFSLKDTIEMKGVCFSYPSSTRQAINNLQCTIQAGTTVALVGENGSGKSTFIKLLCGFYEPQLGEILFDGKATRQWGQESICTNISTVFQDFAFYHLSIRENLALSNIRRTFTEEDMMQALKQVGLSDFVSALPKGLDSLLGNQFLGGEELSVGQWQKMAIARAFLRDADLLLLDEPSSALDANSEAIIINSLHQLTRNKTAILVSHRLRAVQWVDRIFFMENGTIVEQGTHQELMQLQGKYYAMYHQSNS